MGDALSGTRSRGRKRVFRPAVRFREAGARWRMSYAQQHGDNAAYGIRSRWAIVHGCTSS